MPQTVGNCQFFRSFSMKKKIVLIGDPAVGKTTLLNRFISGGLPDAPYQETVGCASQEYVTNIDGEEIVFNIWDTAGSEKYNTLQPLYCRNSAGALIVCSFDSQESLDNLLRWKQTLLDASPECFCLYAANKSDLTDNDPNRQFTNETFVEFCENNSLQNFMAVSAKNNTNVPQLFNCLFSNASKEPKIEPIIKIDDNKKDEPDTEKKKGFFASFC